MTRKRLCDQCDSEVIKGEEENPALEVTKRFFDCGLTSDTKDYDFCSYECLKLWAEKSKENPYGT